MKVIIKPSLIDGKLSAPSSKSVAQRAIACASLANGTSILKNITWSGDVTSALSISENMGNHADIENDSLKITGSNKIISDPWDCGESGLCIRMFSPIAALFEKQITLNASGSLLNRPVKMIEDAFQNMGVKCNTMQGKPPVMVQGPLKGGHFKIDGSESSQLVTGLLIALPLLENDSILEVDSLVSKEYIDITVDVMKKFGVQIENQNYSRFLIPGKQSYKPAEISIEGDWSSASYLLVAAAIAGKMKIEKMFSQSFQPDRKIVDVLLDAGANVKVKSNSVICKHKKLNGFVFNATDCPDLFPSLVALAARSKERSVITGTHRLLNKESNRKDILIREFSKMGVNITLDADSLVIRPGKIVSAVINPENDHRIAMATAVAYLGTNETVTILQAECVNKSYPGFWEELKCMGVHVEIIHEE